MQYKRCIIYLCLWLLIIGVHTSLQAATVDNLYQAIVPVKSQSESERQQAFSEAMGQVLIKLTGNLQVTDKPQVASSIKHAAKFIQQYYYKSIKNNPMLFVNFNSATVDNLLQAVGQQKLSADRPAVLVWLVREVDEKPAIIEENDDIGQQLKLAAEQVGVPVIFPSYDLEDMQQVTLDDIWAPNLMAIEQATQRYQTDKILVGRIIRKNREGWLVQAQFGYGNSWQTLHFLKEQSSEALRLTLQQILSQLVIATNTAVDVNKLPARMRVEIIVNGITGLADYQKALDYLQNLPIVESVQVLNVGADQVTFNLAIQNTENELIQTIEQGELLVSLPNTNPHVLEFDLISAAKL